MKLQINDITGREWVWKCGWRPKHLKPWEKQYVLGHTEFCRKHMARGRVPHKELQADLENRTGREVDMPWRTMRGLLMHHSWDGGDHGYGHVRVMATDGIHAIVVVIDPKTKQPEVGRNNKLLRVEVVLDNLRPIKPVGGRGKGRPKMSDDEKSARKMLRDMGFTKPNKEQVQLVLDEQRARRDEIANLFE